MLLFVLPVVLLGLSLLVRLLVGEDDDRRPQHALRPRARRRRPLVALLATSGLLAPEIDDGSISYLLAKPISRYTIVASKLVVVGGVRGGLRRRADAGRGPGPAARRPGVRRRLRASASLVGGWAYCAVFALLSVMTRHAVVVGLIYLLIWEGLLGGLLDGIRWLSITRWPARSPAHRRHQPGRRPADWRTP